MAKSKRRWPWFVAGAVVALALYLCLWPVPIDPVALEPAPEGAPLAANDKLREAERFSTVIGDDGGHGPETVIVDGEGRIYGGTKDGRIVRMKRDGSGLETFADTGGRPLGLAWDAQGQLIVADAKKGLLSISRDGVITTLATEAGGVAFRFADDVDVAKDGRIYFSDASSRFGYGDHMLDLLEGRPNGRLLRYDPKSRAVEVLLGELYFANGVALGEDDSFVLVNETGVRRVTRLWLSGAHAGEHDVFADALPGYPDGISRGTGGRFWVAIFAPRNPGGERMAPHPFMKKMVARLPRFLWPAPKRFGMVLVLDAEGHIADSLQDPSGEHLWNVTGAEEHDGFLYLGTLDAPQIGRLKIDITH